jgi:uncharacterized protein YuzE
MKIEYDPERDLFYIWFGTVGTKAAETVTVTPGVHADFDAQGKLVGLGACPTLPCEHPGPDA